VSARSRSRGGLSMSAVLDHSGRDPYESRVASTPEIVGRVDPVVYARAGDKGPLTREQLRQYESQGFLEIDNLFDAGEIETLLAELDRLRRARDGLDREIDPETLILEPHSRE